MYFLNIFLPILMPEPCILNKNFYHLDNLVILCIFGFYISYSGKLFFLELDHDIELLSVYTCQV